MKVVFREMMEHANVHVMTIGDIASIDGNILTVSDISGSFNPAQWGYIAESYPDGVYNQESEILMSPFMRENGKPQLKKPDAEGYYYPL